jgi:uncharacterized membrane protein
MKYQIQKHELVQAQIAIGVAIGLQIIAWVASSRFLPVTQFFLVTLELILLFVVGNTSTVKYKIGRRIHHALALALLGLISFANIYALLYVLESLIVGHTLVSGQQLLVSAIAIFMTNILVYALWYWEIDSPGLTLHRWSTSDKDFQFTQQDLSSEFPGWRPEFIDYLYLAVTNAINFAPADTRPLTRAAKLLMASQALVSVFTLALVLARSVSILG